MHRFLRPVLFAAAALSFPAAAQTPPTQGWPANRAAGRAAAPPRPAAAGGAATGRRRHRHRRARAGSGALPAANAPIPLPLWFTEIDTAKKGEVSRPDFLKYRMKTFVELDANKDGKLTLDEFLKVAEPPFTADGPSVAPLEERRARARTEFQNLDTNRDGFVERGEAEALVHAEFNQYDMDRDNKITEPEVRLVMQGTLRREEQARRESRPAAARAWSRSTSSSTCSCAGRPARQEQRRQDQQAGIRRACRSGRRAAGPGPAAVRDAQADRACASSPRSTPTRTTCSIASS